MFNNSNTFEMSVKKYVEVADNTNMVIPNFQRGYVWKKKSYLALLDSINKGFNLGAIIIWESNIEIFRQETNLNFKKIDGNYRYLVDGQQRTMTLVSLFTSRNITGINKKKILITYDSKNKVIKFDESNPKEHEFISFEDFLSYIYSRPNIELDALKESGYNKQISEDFFKRLKRFVQKVSSSDLIVGYRLSNVTTGDLTSAIKQFERINQNGVKLTEFEILDAVSSVDNFDLKKSLIKLNEFKGFVRASDSKNLTTHAQKVVVNSYKLIKNYSDSINEKKKVISMSSTAISNYDHANDKAIFNDIIQGVKKAFSELKKMGFESLEQIPYTHNVTALVFLIWLKKKHEIIIANFSELVENIVLYTGVNQSYDKSASANLVKDLNKIIKNIDNGYLGEITFYDKLFSDAKYGEKKNGLYTTLLYIYVKKMRPIDFITKEEIKFDAIYNDKISMDHIFPQNLYKGRKGIHNFSNLAPITSSTNSKKSNTEPSEFFIEINYIDNIDLYESHGISEDAYNSLISNDYDGFLLKRQRHLTLMLNNN